MIDIQTITENSTGGGTAGNPGNAGFQGDSAGKSVGNDREIPNHPEIPNALTTSAAQNLAVKKVDRRSEAKSRLSDWAGQTCLGDLNSEGEEFVINLCEKHTYAEVVNILAMPRPIGLNLKTSISSLQRFYAYY